MKRSILFLFLLCIQYVNSYLMNPLPFGTNTVGRIFNQFNNDDTDASFKKYSSKGLNPVETKNAIFLPALTGNAATARLYESFLNIMTRKSFDIYVPNTDYQMILDDINNNNNVNNNVNNNTNNNDITLIAHSSSAARAITMANTIESVKTLVLIDPIDVNNGDIDKQIKSSNPVDYDINDINEASKSSARDKKNKNKKFQIENIEQLLIINTKRSNDWSIIPFIFPIGSFAIKPDRFILNENVTQQVVKADDFGHFDILDDRWSNMIHNTLSKGSDERDQNNLELFRAWISNKIVELSVYK